MGTLPSDSLIAHKAINLCDDLSGSEKRVAAAIIDHYNRKTGQCDPGLGTIARLIGVSRRTVIRAVGVLARKGYIRKQRHGGKFHRNQYEPDWSHFRAMETRWNELRSKAIRKPEAPDVSLSQRQTCHIGSDADVTQTLSTNPLNETSAAARATREPRTSNPQIVDQGLSREVKSKAAYEIANERFHVKSTSSKNAAYDAAEGRWNNSLTKQFKAAPDVFAGLIDAIDPDLHRATTDLELRKPGSGLAFLLGELDRRIPLGRTASPATPDKSAVPSSDVTEAGNSDREGSAVSSDFQSLNITKHQA